MVGSASISITKTAQERDAKTDKVEVATGAKAPWDQVAGDVGTRKYSTKAGEKSIRVVCVKDCTTAFCTLIVKRQM